MFNNDWDALLAPEFDKPYYRELTEFLKKEYAEHTGYPERRDIFAALCTTAYRDVRVVIFGQDPYHGEHQAHGLAFSVLPGTDVSGKTLLLIDDIVTTGATLSECCRVLKGAGAARVACAAFASPRNENER